jgi:hypothetical protein
MRRAVRVFIGEGTFCPGFQLKDGLLHEPVLRLFEQAMSLKIPHNVFSRLDGQPTAGRIPFPASGHTGQHDAAPELLGRLW